MKILFKLFLNIELRNNLFLEKIISGLIMIELLIGMIMIVIIIIFLLSFVVNILDIDVIEEVKINFE